MDISGIAKEARSRNRQALNECKSSISDQTEPGRYRLGHVELCAYNGEEVIDDDWWYIEEIHQLIYEIERIMKAYPDAKKYFLWGCIDYFYLDVDDYDPLCKDWTLGFDRDFNILN